MVARKEIERLSNELYRIEQLRLREALDAAQAEQMMRDGRLPRD